MNKLKEAIMGKDGKNLDDLPHMDGKKILMEANKLLFTSFLEFIHTSEVESLNALLLEYLSKKQAYRY